MKIIEGAITAPYARVAVIVARTNHLINQCLLASAVDTLKRVGQVADSNITVVYVPSTHELPLVACCLAKQGDYDAILALGTVIQLESAPGGSVLNGCDREIAQVAIATELPIIFGILVTESVEQAIARTGTHTREDKGMEAALGALEMINILQTIKR